MIIEIRNSMYWPITIGIITGFVVGYIFCYLYEKSCKRWWRRVGRVITLRIKGLHFHHSLYGLGLFILWFFVSSPMILGASLGIITRHTQDEKKLTFIDRS